VANVIDRLPFSSRESTAAVPGGTVRILPFQIALTISVTATEQGSLDAKVPRFPAVLDTGFNRAFLLQEQHLLDWARLQPEELSWIEEITAYGRTIPVFTGNVWLHRNQPGTRNLAPRRAPFCIPLAPGIAVCPRDVGQPRLPLLGTRALFLGNLELLIGWTGKEDPIGQVTLRTPRKKRRRALRTPSRPR
jgi:hypothetical protein